MTGQHTAWVSGLIYDALRRRYNGLCHVATLFYAAIMMRAEQKMWQCGSRVHATCCRYASLFVVLLIGLSLSGCDIPQGNRRPAHGIKKPPAVGVRSPEFKQCAGKLSSLGARYTPLPDKNYGGGCTAYGALQLDNIGVPVTRLGPMTCSLAQHFTAWVRYGVRPAARIYLGSDVVRVDSFGTYNCRRIAGSSRLSEHAKANAVDVAAFLLADGRRISLQNGWNAADPRQRKFLRAVRDSACKRFRTVLSPDYNAAHHDHLHFDMGGRGGYCR